MTRKCSVCVLNDNDHSVKQNVNYCSLCKEWMCQPCTVSLRRRAIAMFRKNVLGMSAE